MDYNNMMPMPNSLEEHAHQATLQHRQLLLLSQQQQYILKQQQQITLYEQQRRVLDLEQQYQDLAWEQQQLQQQPPHVTLHEQKKLQPRHQEVLYHQQQIMHQQRVHLQTLQQQQYQLLQQQQLPVQQRNRRKRAGPYRTAWNVEKCRSQMAQNITAGTIINGRSLMTIVNEHCTLVNIIDDKFKECTGHIEHYTEDLIEKLSIIIKITGEMRYTQNAIAENRTESYTPVPEPEVIIDYVKELTTQPEMTLTATFHDNSLLSHEDISKYAEHYKVSRSEILSWCEYEQNERKDNSQRQIKYDEEPDETFKIKFPGPSC